MRLRRSGFLGKIPGDATLSARVYSRLSDVPPIEWSYMRQPAGLYQSPDWWSTMEVTGPKSVRYVAALDALGSVVGIAPLYLFKRAAAAGQYRPAVTLGDTTSDALGIGDRNIAILGGRAGYYTGWSLRADHPRPQDILRCILSAADRTAMDSGMSCLCAQYLPRSEAELLVQTGAVDSSEIVFQNFSCWMSADGADFDEYCTALSYNHRRTVRRDLEAFESSGCSLELLRISDALDFFPRLSKNVMNSHGKKTSEESQREMLRIHAKILDGLGMVVLSRDPDGIPIASSISYIYADTMHVRLAGIDYERARKSASYFVTTYYEPIRHAFARDIGRVRWGIGALKPKLNRGACLEPLYGFFRGRAGAGIGPARREAVEERLLAELRSEVGDMGRLPDVRFR